MKNKLAIIGHFGGGNVFNDGQTVKTLNLYNELKDVLDEDIVVVDTYYNKKNTIKLLFETVRAIFTTKNIIVLLSKNGLKVFLPILYFGKKFLGVNVFHDVIGGNLGHYIDQNPNFKKYLNAIDSNIVETTMLKNDLLERGINNVEIIPNFRRMNHVDSLYFKNNYEEPYEFATFSRVIKEKGIGEAIEAIETINSKYGRQICKLDIYGPIDDGYKEEFDGLLTSSSSAVRYKGEVNTKEAVKTLKSYYAVLFPTYWPSESNAGTISESFFAGVPVIATDWRCNSEMIRNGYNGIVYPCELANDLVSGIDWIINLNTSQINKIKENCIESSKYYQPDQHIKRLLDMMKI